MSYKGKAKQYEAGRPSYSNDVIDFIVNNSNEDATIADIGAGTGKLTRKLATRFAKVFAVEPDKEMRRELDGVAAELSNIVVIDGSAESTGLDNNIVDIICVAQALHWFNIPLFKKEISRILRPNGKVFIIHNTPPIVTTTIKLNENENLETIQKMFAKRKEDRINFFGKDLCLKVFDNPITYNKEQYTQYFMSLSTIDTDDETKKNLLIEKIESEFDKVSENGRVTLHFTTEVYTNNGC